MFSLSKQVLLHSCLHITIKHIETLKSAAFLRREIEVVVSIMLVLAHACLRQLALRLMSSVACNFVNVLFNARSSVECHVHYIQSRLALILQ